MININKSAYYYCYSGSIMLFQVSSVYHCETCIAFMAEQVERKALSIVHIDTLLYGLSRGGCFYEKSKWAPATLSHTKTQTFCWPHFSNQKMLCPPRIVSSGCLQENNLFSLTQRKLLITIGNTRRCLSPISIVAVNDPHQTQWYSRIDDPSPLIFLWIGELWANTVPTYRIIRDA